ncbi:MAG: phosphate acyltransferase PlsX [Sedimentisphaerales bacterium]|nr:phosphate acyltransferase PlsX [Sedimentisphaerales bacterium]
MRIALDGMGGDRAPNVVVAGALQALGDLDDDTLILFGDEPVLRELLGPAQIWEKAIRIEHAPEVIGMDEQPVDALRRKRHSSIAVMAKHAAEQQVDVTISAGNTGAYVAACQMRLRPLPGVLRPGIMVVFPTFGGPVTVCDVGANIAPKPAHLYQYALMASLYAREVLSIENPSVGLISIGQEDAKGNELVRKTNQLLRDDERIRFVGNVETRDFLNRPADVIVCDGFVGNVILKLTEGLAEGLFKSIKRELSLEDPEFVHRIQPIIDRMYARHDYSEYGGAPLLGVDGTCIICHGSSDERAIKNAILRCRDQVKLGINKKIAAELQKVAVDDGEIS